MGAQPSQTTHRLPALVCRYWRDESLKCPTLRSQAKASKLETVFLQEILWRSIRASLHIVANVYDLGEAGGLKRALVGVDRIESLKITSTKVAPVNLGECELPTTNGRRTTGRRPP